MCLIVAVVVGALAITPGVWLVAGRAWLAGAVAWLGALNPRLGATIVGGVALALAALLAVLPIAPRRYRRNAQFAGRAPAMPLATARTLVYLDAENQPALDFAQGAQRNAPDKMLAYLIELLRTQLNAQRADLLFYMDNSLPLYADRRRYLYRYGFRLVDVPHNPFGTTGDKPNMVDMELALQAHGRSLASAQRQHIILISADQDYIPLIYHLWQEGHTVEVWGDFLAESFRQMQLYLPVKVIEYDPQSPGANPMVAAALEANNPLDETAAARLAEWIRDTISIVQATNDDNTISPNVRNDIYSKRLAKKIPWLPISVVPYWLAHLRMAGALTYLSKANTDAQGYQVGASGPEDAAARSGLLLRRIAEVALAMRAQTVRHYVTLERLCEVVLRRPVSAPIETLAQVLSPRAPQPQIAYAQMFCLCARALGLLEFDQQALFSYKRLAPATAPVSAPVHPPVNDAEDAS